MTTQRFLFPDAAASVCPPLAVADLPRSLEFWVTQLGGDLQVQWDTYARVRVGSGQVHLAVTGDPPPDRAVRLVPPTGAGAEAPGEVVIEVDAARPSRRSWRSVEWCSSGPPPSRRGAERYGPSLLTPMVTS